MPITALPTPPSRQDPANFAARGDALLSALPTFVTEANALQVDVNAKQAGAAASAIQGTTAALNASNNAIAAAASAGATIWVSGTTYEIGNARYSPIDIQVYRRITAGAGTTDPSSDSTNWALAVDQHRTFAQLAYGLAAALDIAGQAADWPLNVARAEALLAAVCVALDLAGVTAKQVNGGAVQLAAGTPAEPALWPAADRNTGLYFPAADVMALVTAGLERLRLDAAGNLGIGTNAPSGMLDVNDNRLRVRTAKTPASATAAGNAGEICWDAGYVYVCTATNVWRRAALVAW